MERKVFVALAFGVETREALTGHDIALEVAYLSLMQYLLAVLIFAAGVGSRSGCADELFTVEQGEKICGLALKTVALGFAGTGHRLLFMLKITPHNDFTHAGVALGFGDELYIPADVQNINTVTGPGGTTTT